MNGDPDILKVNDPYYVWDADTNTAISMLYIGSPNNGKSHYFSNKPMGMKGDYKTYDNWMIDDGSQSLIKSLITPADQPPERRWTQSFEDGEATKLIDNHIKTMPKKIEADPDSVKSEIIKNSHIHAFKESGKITLTDNPTYEVCCSVDGCDKKVERLVSSSPEKVAYICNMNAHYKGLVERYQSQIVLLAKQKSKLESINILEKSKGPQLKSLAEIKAKFWCDCVLMTNRDIHIALSKEGLSPIDLADDLLIEFNKRFDPEPIIITGAPMENEKGGDCAKEEPTEN